MKYNFPKIEEKILKFWKKNKIFEKSILQRKKAKKFVFYDGPITVNARPGIHHVLARIFKDIIPRFKTMRGFRVERKNGWDTHGLPVELEVEKNLDFKTKRDIEKYGLAKFNRACKKNVQKYIPLFRDLTEKIGYWVDMEDPYITYENDYIETVWWILKKIWQKGLLYKGYKVVPYCPRCGTSLSSHEVAQGYKRIKEPAIYIKFKLKSQKNTYFLVWTTTPWTLPGNVAIAINPNFVYSKIKINGQFLILAKKRIEALDLKGEIVKDFKGENLLGVEYRPLFDFIKPKKGAYYIISGDFVSIENGTGLVHIAPAFGEEDMAAGKKNNLPILLNVDEEGKFKKEVKNWAGLFVKEADPKIIEDLKKRNLIFKTEQYEHDYPFCWRCKSPLLYYAKESWFINMQKVKKDLIKNNQKINWIPTHLKDGRFGEWLREVKDWALSRERYWGTPLPIWQCKKCGNLEIIGSKKDLISQKFSQNKYFILRHGKTAHQTKKGKGIIYDWPETSSFPLTKKGEKKIAKLAKKLKKREIDLIYSSDALRTRQTAEIVAKELSLKVNFNPKLRDINLGIYQRRKTEEFHRDFPINLKRFSKKPKKGESWTEVRKRMVGFIKDIDKKHKGKTILIVSHGDPIWLLRGAMKGLKNQESLKKTSKKHFIKTSKLRKLDFKNLPYNKKGNLDFHRPFIDEVKFLCPKCENLMEREKEVIDCWFDSGAMPFAQYHYPFENKKLIDKRKRFPADYIAEAIDQTRGWFYTLLAISTLLGFGPSYKNVISVGHVLDKKGEKMSKSKGNMVDPWVILERYSADALRWYFFTVNQPFDSKLFSEKEVKEALRRFILTLLNSYVFFETYGLGYLESKKLYSLSKSKNILDRWIVSKLNGLISEVTKDLESYDVTGATRKIENFVIEDLSQWYIQVSRKRFHSAPGQSLVQDKETRRDFGGVSQTLGFVLFTLSKLVAPFMPFFSEDIYQKFRAHHKLKTESIHLEDWPKADKGLIDRNLNRKMERVREVVALGLRERSRLGIKVRQPLREMKVLGELIRELGEEEKDIIKGKLNIKNLLIASRLKGKIELDTKITLELREEGMIREIIRQIQEMRKLAGLKPKDRILIHFFGSASLNKVLIKNKDFILKEVKAKDFQLIKKSKTPFKIKKDIKINQEKLQLAIRKIK